MRWTDAARLYNEDKVVVKETKEVMSVINIDIDKENHNVEVMLDDGNWYNHRDIIY